MSEEDDNGHKFYIKVPHAHRRRKSDKRKVKVPVNRCRNCGLKFKFRKKVKCPAK